MPQDELNHPKVEGNGALIFDMVADFPPYERSRWSEWNSDYLFVAMDSLKEGVNQIERKRSYGKEVDNGDEYDHKPPALRDTENEMVAVLSYVNQKSIRPTTKETLGMNKPRSKGRRLQFASALDIELGPNTSENADKPKVFGETAFEESEKDIRHWV